MQSIRGQKVACSYTCKKQQKCNRVKLHYLKSLIPSSLQLYQHYLSDVRPARYLSSALKAASGSTVVAAHSIKSLPRRQVSIKMETLQRPREIIHPKHKNQFELQP